MAQTALQKMGGALRSLAAINANFDDLYAWHGISAGNPFATDRFVDGDHGSDTNDGLTPANAFKTIQAAVDASAQGDRIFIKPLEADSASGDTDPDSYAESITITAKDGLQLIGVGRGLAQGGQPQLKVGSTTTNPIITVNSFGVGIHNLTINGAGATGGGVKLVANGSTYDAGGFIASGCHFKNCKSSGAAATGGAIYWTTSGGCWYVTIRDCEFFDCRCGVAMLGTGVSIPKGVKILGCRFWSSANTNVDADIYVAADGILGLLVSDCDFGTVDVPAYATSPTAAHYLKLGAGTKGLIARCTFACVADPAGTEKTFGDNASVTAAEIPTTVRMVACWGEGVVASADQALVGRTS